MLRGRASGGSGSRGKTDWMTTFSDLVTLLMTFFVLLLTMSSMDAKKLKETFGFFTGTVGAFGAAANADVSPDSLTHKPTVLPNTFDALLGPDPFPPAQVREESIEDLLRKSAKRALQSDLVEVERTTDGAILRLAGTAAFGTDDAGALTASAERLLLDVSDLAMAAGMLVEVGVNVAPAERRVESAWSRATVLGDRVAQLVEKRGGVPGRDIAIKTYGRPSDRLVQGESTTLSITLTTRPDGPDGAAP